MGEAGFGRSRPWGRPLVVAALMAVALLPVLLVAHPPLQDYPNHLARLYVLAHPDDPVLAAWYRPDWALRPNLGFDLAGVALTRLMPAEAAARLFLAIAVALFASAPVALERALRGEFHGTALLALPLAFNLVLQKGFLAYYLGIGLAVWGYAAWVAVAGHPLRRAVVAHLAAALLFVTHLYALGVFLVLVAGHWLAERPAGRAGPRHLAEGLATLSAFVLPAILFLATPTAAAAGEISWRPLGWKLAGLVGALTLNPTLPALAVVGLAFLPLGLALVRRRPPLEPVAAGPVLLLAAAALAFPDQLMSSHNADWRIVPPLALVALAATRVPWPGRAGQQAVVALAAVLTVVASTAATVAWSEGDRVARAFDRLTGALAPGTRLFPVILDARPQEAGVSYQHIAARAVLRGVLVPSLFAIPSQQPLRFTAAAEPLREPLGAVFYGDGRPLDWALVERTQDCVLLIHTDRRSFGTAPALPIAARPVGRTGRFTLYAVAASKRGCPAPG